MKRKKRKRSAFQKFMYVFLRSIFTILALFIAGFISYKITLLYYDHFGGPSDDDKSAKLIRELYGEVEVTDVAKNLIYCVGEDKEIKAVVLEIFNTNTYNMDYITIPMKSQFTVSNELYQKLCASGCDAPQIIKLSKMDNYFSDETLYEYGVILLEDLLDIDIDYYTAVPVEEFKKAFKQGDATIAYAEDGTTMQSYYEWHLKKSFINQVRELSESELEDFVKEEASLCESSLNTKSKVEYVKSYVKVNPDYIYEHSLYGIIEGGEFEVYVDESNQLIQTILNNATYTTEQTDTVRTAVTKVSLGYSIEILNGSQIDGLAAKYQSELSDAGYMISSIGNYNGGTVTQTKIRVSEEGLGTDLTTYFTNAIVEKADLDYGCDIQIILGTDANTEAASESVTY